MPPLRTTTVRLRERTAVSPGVWEGEEMKGDGFPSVKEEAQSQHKTAFSEGPRSPFGTGGWNFHFLAHKQFLEPIS
jgi:hypothetical protein